MINNRFQFLGIRPLPGCGNKYLKNLSDEHIYWFYDEYNYERNQDGEIKSIRHTPLYPDGFFNKKNKR